MHLFSMRRLPITLTGLLMITVSLAEMFTKSPHASASTPIWVYATAASGLSLSVVGLYYTIEYWVAHRRIMRFLRSWLDKEPRGSGELDG